jgi:hypothetical protein
MEAWRPGGAIEKATYIEQRLDTRRILSRLVKVSSVNMSLIEDIPLLRLSLHSTKGNVQRIVRQRCR